MTPDVSRQIQEQISQAERELVTIPVTQITATAIGSAQTIITAPDRGNLQFNVLLCNSGMVADTVSAHVVPSGGSATAANQILNALSITTTGAIEPWTKNMLIIPAGSSLQVYAGTSSDVNISGWGHVIRSGDAF